MYAYIKGELAETNPDHIVIETGGIGYQVFISGQTFEYLPAVGEEIKVYTYLYLREDAMILYGFLTKDDLELFKLLISVSGIGPKGGLAILSALSADDLRFAVLSGDSKAISKAPGVGAKTAQRVILELKDKAKMLYVDYNDVYAEDGTVKMKHTRKVTGEEVVNVWSYFLEMVSLVENHKSCLVSTA